MADITDLPVMTRADAQSIGFAGYNDVPHKPIDIPDGNFTITAKTSDGRRVTFCFMPKYDGGPARFIDIQFIDRGSTIANANRGRSPTFNSFAITKGGRHVVDSRPLSEDTKPSILVLLLDTLTEEAERAAAARPKPTEPGTDKPSAPQIEAESNPPPGRTLREVAWSFDEGMIFPGYTDDSWWNGYLNIWVDLQTWPYVLRELLAADSDPETIAQYHAMSAPDGLVSLAYGFTTTAVASPWRTAFPDYPIATMPPLPSSWTDMSWRNESAPSFGPCTGPMGEAVQIWIDYADPSLRENADGERFTLCRRDASGELETIYAGNDYDVAMEHAAREVLACAFAKNLALVLTAGEWRDMRLRNRTTIGPVCASHDFLDANMVMLAAWEHCRRPPLPLSGPDADIGNDVEHINAAWAIAKRHYLTASDEGARFDDWRLTGIAVDSLVAAGHELGGPEGYDMPGRVYSSGFIEEDEGKWLVNVANSSQSFDRLAEAEAHLWALFASQEARHSVAQPARQ